MTEKHDVTGLHGVPETLLITLYARKLETEREGGLFQDPKAVDIVSQIDYDFSRFDGHPAMPSLALRVKVIDDATRAFLAETPDGVVVQLGAGLDSRFERLDNGRVRWYELDLPQTIALRERFFTTAPRRQNIASSVLDFRWMDEIPQDGPVFFTGEGLFTYLQEAEVKQIVQTLAGRFPDSSVIFDTVPPLMARRSHRSGAQARTSAVDATANEDGSGRPWPWGTVDGRMFEQWNPRIKLVAQHRYMQLNHPNFPSLGRLIMRLPLVGKHFAPLVVQLGW